MRKIKKYYLISADSKEILEKKINDCLDNDWDLHGDTFFTGSTFFQAVVQYYKEKKQIL